MVNLERVDRTCHKLMLPLSEDSEVMATFFGEVIFSSSRAIDDDENDDQYDEGNNERILLELLAPFSSHQFPGRNFKHLVFTLGEAANVFTECFILHQETETIGTFKVTNNSGEKPVSGHTPSEGAVLQRLTSQPDVLICNCRETFGSHLWFSFVKQLFKFLDGSKVTVNVLLSLPGSEYKTASLQASFPVLRSLKTSTFIAKPSCPYLESPNTVGGLGAAVLSHCEVHRLPAVMYVLYTESVFLDSNTVTAFTTLRAAEPFSQISKRTDASEELLKSAMKKPSNLDSLYI